MALIGNYSLLQKSFERTIGGVVASGNRSNWNTSGAMRNWGKQTGLNWNLAAVPQGHSAGGAWMLPKTAGGMTSRREARVTFRGSGNGAEGYGIAGTAAFSVDMTGFAGLIVGAVGTASFSVTGSGEIAATIGSPGTATISFAGAANIGAIGWLGGESVITVSGALTPYAKGHMVGTTAEAGLTPVGIANAIGARIIEAGLSFDEIIRILAAQAAGPATGLESSNPQFFGLDGETLRIDGTYAAGTRTIDSLNGA